MLKVIADFEAILDVNGRIENNNNFFASTANVLNTGLNVVD